MKDIGKMIYNMVKEKRNVDTIFNLIGADNSSYKGDYYEGKKQGRGKYIWPDGSYFEGDWYDNRISGYVNNILYFRVNIFGQMVEHIKVNG